MKIKLKGAKAVERSSGFEPYDGPTPTRKGFYRAVIKKLQYRRNKNSQSMGFYIVAELEAAPGDPKDQAVYDGYPLFISSIITETSDESPLKEGAQRNLDNFLAALDSGDEPDVILEDGDPEDGVDVKKIGRVNPIGRAVNIDIGFETYMGEQRPKANGVYKVKDETVKSTRNVVDDFDAEEEDDITEDDDAGYAERQEELEAASLAELKAILKSDYDLPSSGTKPKLIERILEHEFAEAEDEEEPEDEDAEEVDEADDADEAEEDEAEDDEEEDEEEEDEDDEAYNARVEELEGFNRVALKKVLSTLAPDFTVLKRHTDEQLREQILANEFGDELPF